MARGRRGPICLGMRRFLVELALTACLGLSVACSTVPVQRGRQTDIDSMFQRLRTTQDPVEAHTIEIAIRHAWAHSGRDSIDRLMNAAVNEIQAEDTGEALATLDRVVADAPDFAEGWNLRATVHYLRDEYGDALGDIRHVLALEPRHFAALAGLGRIFLDLDQKRAALKAFEAALTINPHLDDIKDEVDTLQEQLAGILI